MPGYTQANVTRDVPGHPHLYHRMCETNAGNPRAHQDPPRHARVLVFKQNLRVPVVMNGTVMPQCAGLVCQDDRCKWAKTIRREPRA